MSSEDLIREFHEHAFGEEMARVNFLLKKERWAYVRTLWQRAYDRTQRGDRIETLHGAERIWDGEPEFGT